MISATKEQVEEAVVKIITENKNNDRETDLAKSGAGLSSYILILMSAAMVIVFVQILETLPRLMLIQEEQKYL